MCLVPHREKWRIESLWRHSRSRGLHLLRVQAHLHTYTLPFKAGVSDEADLGVVLRTQCF